jgi:hypothetical protein
MGAKCYFQQNFSYIIFGSISCYIGGGKKLEKTINLVQITYKFDHMKLYQVHLATGGIKLTA